MLVNYPFIPFKNSWDRIKRAEAHSFAFGDAWKSFSKTELHTAVLHIDDDGTGTLRCVPAKSAVPSHFPLLLGEMLYQLRAALDNAIYDAAIIDSNHYPPPNAGDLEFPICVKARHFKQVARTTIAPLSATHRALVEALQPYNASQASAEGAVLSIQRSLRILKDWTQTDRHRTLSVFSSWVTHTKPELKLPEGVHLKSMRIQRRGFLEDGDIMARFRLKGFVKGMNVQIMPDLHFDLALDEAPIACHHTDDLSTRTNMMLLTVKEIVRKIETC